MNPELKRIAQIAIVSAIVGVAVNYFIEPAAKSFTGLR